MPPHCRSPGGFIAREQYLAPDRLSSEDGNPKRTGHLAVLILSAALRDVEPQQCSPFATPRVSEET